MEDAPLGVNLPGKCHCVSLISAQISANSPVWAKLSERFIKAVSENAVLGGCNFFKGLRKLRVI